MEFEFRVMFLYIRFALKIVLVRNEVTVSSSSSSPFTPREFPFSPRES
jgi:hypothetical protein